MARDNANRVTSSELPPGISLLANKNMVSEVIDDPKHLTSNRLEINGSDEHCGASSVTENHRINSPERSARKSGDLLQNTEVAGREANK